MNRAFTLLAVVALLFSSIAMVGAADESTDPAELFIEQESYIDSPVDVTEEDGERVYHAAGAEVDIAPRNFDADDVIDAGVRGEVGRLSYDEDTTRWTLDPEETDGTYKVWFLVREEVEVEVEKTVVDEETGEERTVTETETREVENQYEAVIDLDQTAVTVVDKDEHADMKEDANRWQEWERGVERLFGSDVDVEQKTEAAFGFLVFLASPLAYLTGGYTSTWIMMLTTPGGLMVGATIALFVLALMWGYFKYGNMRAARDAARARLDEVMQEIEQETINRSMALMTLHSVFSDENTAEVMAESIGSTNLKDAWDTYKGQIVTHGEVLADRLACMAADGYVAVEGEDGLRVVKEENATGDVTELTELDEEDMLEIQNDDAVERYSLPDSDVTPASLNIDIDTLNERLGEQPTSVREKEEQAERLLELVTHVRKHEHTDYDGRVLPVREMLETMMQLTREAEKYNGPMSRYHMEQLLYLLNNHSVSEEAQALIEETRAGNIGEGGEL